MGIKEKLIEKLDTKVVEVAFKDMQNALKKLEHEMITIQENQVETGQLMKEILKELKKQK